MKRTVKGKATADVDFKQVYEGREITGRFSFRVTVEADYYYCPGRMYLRNGDPGYPEEEEFDLTDVKDTEFLEFEDLSVEMSPEEEDKFIEWLMLQDDVNADMRQATDSLEIDDYEWDISEDCNYAEEY